MLTYRVRYVSISPPSRRLLSPGLACKLQHPQASVFVYGVKKWKHCKFIKISIFYPDTGRVVWVWCFLFVFVLLLLLLKIWATLWDIFIMFYFANILMTKLTVADIVGDQVLTGWISVAEQLGWGGGGDGAAPTGAAISSWNVFLLHQ